jgi:hypothetical protein
MDPILADRRCRGASQLAQRFVQCLCWLGALLTTRNEYQLSLNFFKSSTPGVTRMTGDEAMKHSLKALVLGSLGLSMLPHALLAIEPDVGLDTKPKTQSIPVDRSCVQVPDSYRTIGPLTVEEIEAESLRDWDKKKQQEWKAFLRQLRTGDKLFMYDEGCCTGIVIVRKGCIVDWFPTSES